VKKSAVGRVVAVCVGPGGLPKLAVEKAEVSASGLEGDGHRSPYHGGVERAVCLLSAEEVDRLERDGVSGTEPGAFGENLRTEGVDLGRLFPGDRLKIGERVVLEVHDVREPCQTLQSVDERFPDLMVGRSGILARVLSGGEVSPNQAIRQLPPDSEAPVA